MRGGNQGVGGVQDGWMGGRGGRGWSQSVGVCETKNVTLLYVSCTARVS